MLTDHAHRLRQRLIHPRPYGRALHWLRVAWAWLDPATDHIGVPEPHDDGSPHPDTYDPDTESKLADARRFLGSRWRGLPNAEHRYTNSDGVTVEVEIKEWP